MSRFLFATVPLSGHVNPGLPIARRLLERGHEVVWYSGPHFRERIEATGACFEPFRRAVAFHDETVRTHFGKVPVRLLMAHAGFYIRKVFYDPMLPYYQDLQDILLHFSADALITDEWFTGAIPLAEKGVLPWVMFGNSPLLMFADDFPTPGTGQMPPKNLYQRKQIHFANLIGEVLFIPIQRYINRLRAECGLPRLSRFFAAQNLHTAALVLKFNTEVFEFPHGQLPASVHFVGPVLPENGDYAEHPWLERIRSATIPNIFLTQGSVDSYDIRKLILPTIKALKHFPANLLISTGGRDPGSLKALYPQDNIIIERYIPYTVVVPHLRMMITNGGYGGVSTALRFGVPLIIAGNSEDKPEIASRIRYCGAGINLNTGRPSPAAIRRAVRKILHEPYYTARAQRVQADYARHDAVSESVALIEGIKKLEHESTTQ